MNYAEFKFRCTFETPALLSHHKGSGIRGLFGHCLKKVACAQKQSSCDNCLLNSTCVYFQIFESPKLQGGRHTGNVRPHPFVLVPPGDTSRREFAPGEQFDMTFKLFGPAIEWLPYMVFCAEQMGKRGLGARNRHGWGRFRLDEVRCGEAPIYSGETRILEYKGKKKVLDVQKITPMPVDNIEVFFMLPLRLKSKNRLTDSIDFQTLIRACCRRMAALEDAFGEGEPDLDYKGLINKAAEIRTVMSDTRWERVYRYSNRQRTTMNIGGVVGRVQYRGDIAPYWPLLKYAETVHIGKQTAFGNGRIAVMAC